MFFIVCLLVISMQGCECFGSWGNTADLSWTFALKMMFSASAPTCLLSPSDFCFFSVCTNILVSSGFRWFSRLLWEVKTSQCKQHGQNVLFHTAQHPPFDYRLCADLLLENISFNLILLFGFGFDMDLVVLQIHVTHYLRHCLFFIVCPLMCLIFLNICWNINFIVTAAYRGLMFTNKNKLRIIYQNF